MLDEFRDVFRIKSGVDPPVDVPPLLITRQADAKPYRSPQRRYAPQKRDFITQNIQELEAVEAIYKNISARWTSPALAVSKPGSAKLRFTVDLRGSNARTVPIQPALPIWSRTFRMYLEAPAWVNLTVHTAIGRYPSHLSPKRWCLFRLLSVSILQNAYCKVASTLETTSEPYLQKNSKVDKMLQWIDDFLSYATEEDELLQNLKSFCKVCQEKGIKIHAEKTILFSGEVQFCGRIISADGLQYHPGHYESVTAMRTPTMASELQQFVCASNWMRNSIQSYSERIAPLHQLLEEIYTKAGKRKKRALRNLSLSNSWRAKHDSAFADIKQQLAASVKLAHTKSSHNMCLFTDASENHWAAVETQVPTEDERRAVNEQRYEPLCFLSGSFSSSSANWSVPEKEGFAIVEAMCRLHYLVMGCEVNIFTDHANLDLYDPTAEIQESGDKQPASSCDWPSS